MKDRVEVKRNIININKNLNEIDTYIYLIVKKILNTSELLEIKKENNLYKVYINNNLYCNIIIDYNVIMYDCMLKLIINNKTYTYYIDCKGNTLDINMHEYSYKKDNKEFFIAKYSSVYEGVIIDKDKKVNLIIDSLSINNNIFNNILENINTSLPLEDIYSKLNKYSKIKIIKSRLINNNEELVTDYIRVIDNLLEELKLTINKEDKKYIIEKTGDNYTVTYINQVVCDIEESYFNVTDNMKFIKKLEKKNKLN